MAPILEVRKLVAKYGDFQALFGIDFDMTRGSIVALIGANGAGKSTFLKSIAGQMPNKQGEIRFEGQEIGALASDEIVARASPWSPKAASFFAALPSRRTSRSAPFPAGRDAGRSTRSTPCFRCCGSGGRAPPPRSPAGSSRWSRSAAR